MLVFKTKLMLPKNKLANKLNPKNIKDHQMAPTNSIQVVPGKKLSLLKHTVKVYHVTRLQKQY
jgi:hypothetical protein